MEEELTKLKDRLKRLEKAQQDNEEAGGISKYKKGDMYTDFKDLDEQIRQTKEKISLLEANI